jgi:hypothetical protein
MPDAVEAVEASSPSLTVSPTEWQERVESWQRSGLSQREFCRLHGYALATFNRQARRWLGKSTEAAVAPPREAPQWLEVRMSNSRLESFGKAEGLLGEGFELVLARGCRVRLGPHFDAEGLRRLLSVLESLSC